MKEYLTYAELKRMTWARIERLQGIRFRATVRYLLPMTPFYNDLFHERGIRPRKLKRVEDWQLFGLPLVKKSLFRKRPEDFVARPDEKGLFFKHLRLVAAIDLLEAAGLCVEALAAPGTVKRRIKAYYTPKMPVFSGGTESGKPTPVFITAQQKHVTLQHILSLIGNDLIPSRIPQRSVGMNLFPYAPHLGWHAVHQALDMLTDLNLSTAAGGALSTERLTQIAASMHPNVLCGMSAYLRHRFLPALIKAKVRLPEKVLFINSAMKMYGPERDEIMRLARNLGVEDATVLDLYAASELKEDLMPECAPHSGYHHIAPLSAILRTVNAKRASADLIEEYEFTPPADGGTGVLWNIDGAGTLLAGYATGDEYSMIDRRPCPFCRLPVERIMGVDRLRDTAAQLRITGIVEAKVKGALVNLSAIRARLLSQHAIREAQIIVRKGRKGDRLIARLVPAAGAAGARAAAKKALSADEIRPTIEVTTLTKLRGDSLKFEGVKILRTA